MFGRKLNKYELFHRGSETQLQNLIYPLQPLQRGDRLQSSESDVCRRQILSSKVDLRTVRIHIIILDVDPYLRYSNESETANWDIYDDFK